MSRTEKSSGEGLRSLKQPSCPVLQNEKGNASLYIIGNLNCPPNMCSTHLSYIEALVLKPPSPSI